MPSKRSGTIRPGFTLIELMTVVLVIMILAGILLAVGSQIKEGAKRRSTLATLKLLQGMMQEYLSMGNGECYPPPTYANSSANPPSAGWPYGDPTANGYSAGNPPPPPAYAPTLPGSDPINWVAAFRLVPELNKKLTSLVQGHDIFVNNGTGGNNMVILDAWGNPIRYVPSSSTGGGQAVPPNQTVVNTASYFVSAGPDGIFVNSFEMNGSTKIIYSNGYGPYGPVSGQYHPKHDDLYSTDPQ